MTQPMTPSVEKKATTAGQITKAVANYRALLEKHSLEFNSEAVQQALGQSGLADDMFTVFRNWVEKSGKLIVRVVKADFSRTPEEAITATKRKQYVNSKVVATMPPGDGKDPRTVFFKLDLSSRNGWISDDDLEKEYASRGLKPKDPFSLAAVNEADPAFADKHPNATHWKDADGNWCYAAFVQWLDDGRSVNVNRDGLGWFDRWWFAGEQVEPETSGSGN